MTPHSRTLSRTRTVRWPCCHRAYCAFIMLSLFMAGCATSIPRPWESLTSKGASDRDDEDRDLRRIDNVVGPLQRLAMAGARTSEPATAADRADRDAVQAAHELFERGEYAEAEKRLKVIARKRDPSKFKLFSRKKEQQKYDAIREEAIFYMAECQYMQKSYNLASQHYRQLIKDYPATRYMDESTRRLFDISKPWLGIDDFVTTGEIRQVGLEDGDRRSEPLSKEAGNTSRSFLPKFGDPTRPALDPSGHAIQCLQTIWMNDPTGPLADDALMLAATYYVRTSKYQDADRLFTILREQFPRSDHLQTAFVLGSHVKLMSYQGAEYDEQKLTDARKLKESTLRLFPDVPEADRIRRELKEMDEAEARRDWEVVELYQRKRNRKAQITYCRLLLEEHGTTSYADRARQRLKELGQPVGNGVMGGGSVGTSSSASPWVPFQSQPASGTGSEDEPDQVFEPNGPIFDEPAPAKGSGDSARVRL